MRYVLIVCIALSAVSLNAWADRVALVIGNAAYQNGALRNPANDAADVSAKLKSLGFQVVSGTNLDRDGMFRKVQEFRSALKPGGVGLFFYSGHGVEVAGRNYLLPVNNAVIRTVEDVEIHGFEAQRLVSQMEAAGTQLNVVILDACRDNPLPSTVRSASKGLGRMDAQQGTLIAYATKEGQVAADGSGRNSPYTQALLKHLGEPGLEVSQLFNRVGLEVSTSTRGVQVPWVSSSPVPPVMLAGVGMMARPSPNLSPDRGQVVISVSPTTATVRVDGALVGTGAKSIVEADGTTLKISADAPGYEAVEETVRVLGGQSIEVSLRLEEALLRGRTPDTSDVSAMATRSPESGTPRYDQSNCKLNGYSRYFGSIAAINVSNDSAHSAYNGACAALGRQLGDYVAFDLPEPEPHFKALFYYYTGNRSGGYTDIWQAWDKDRPIVRVMHDGEGFYFWARGAERFERIPVAKSKWYGIRIAWSSNPNEKLLQAEVLEVGTRVPVTVTLMAAVMEAGLMFREFKWGLISGSGDGMAFFDQVAVNKKEMPEWLCDGDANNDGMLNSADIDAIKKAIEVGGRAGTPGMPDADGDGYLTMKDVDLVSRLVREGVGCTLK